MRWRGQTPASTVNYRQLGCQ